MKFSLLLIASAYCGFFDSFFQQEEERPAEQPAQTGISS
jgi:hypothetical protein